MEGIERRLKKDSDREVTEDDGRSREMRRDSIGCYCSFTTRHSCQLHCHA